MVQQISEILFFMWEYGVLVYPSLSYGCTEEWLAAARARRSGWLTGNLSPGGLTAALEAEAEFSPALRRSSRHIQRLKHGPGGMAPRRFSHIERITDTEALLCSVVHRRAQAHFAAIGCDSDQTHSHRGSHGQASPCPRRFCD